MQFFEPPSARCLLQSRIHETTDTVHNLAIQQWLFNHRGAVTLGDIPKLRTVLGDIIKVTLFVSSSILLEETDITVILVGNLVVRTNQLCSVNDFLEPGHS